MFRKVLVLSASAGAGHGKSGQALVRAFGQLKAAEEIYHLDTLEYTSKGFRKFYANVQYDLARTIPELAGWFYDRFDKPWVGERQRMLFEKLNTRLFMKMIQRNQPELVVCTHFLPAELVSYLLGKGKIKTRHAVVITDYHVHAMWLCHHFDRYFAPSDEAGEYLRRLGLPADKISVIGLPIDPGFTKQQDRAALCSKYKLNPLLPTILVSAGGYGAGPMELMLDSLYTIRHPAQVIAVCGRNEELKSRLEKATRRKSDNLTVHITGYTEHMDELMSVSDFMVGKPGGMTISESLAKGLVLVIVNPIPGQEERNADYLLEEGVAVRCNNLPLLGYKIDKLLDDPARMAGLKKRALAFARPDAALNIVKQLLADRVAWKKQTA